jgi:adenosine kinase
MRREFGGCAGNIAYNLKLLGGDPDPDGHGGPDFGPTRALRALRHPRCDHVRRSGTLHRAGLHHHRPGRQPDHRLPPGRDDAFAREPRVKDVRRRRLRHRRPGRPRGHAAARREFAELGPLHLRPRPGHAAVQRRGVPRRFIEQATYVTVNDYESNLLPSAPAGARGDRRAGEGLHRHPRRRGLARSTPATASRHPLPPTPMRVVDPTGCGDAYRAGLIYGLMNDLDWPPPAASPR